VTAEEVSSLAEDEEEEEVKDTRPESIR